MRLRILAVAAATALVATVAPASAAHAAKAPYKVTIKISASSADVGQKVTVSGKVRGPKSAKKVILVQRKVGAGAWKTVQKTRTTKKSRYSTKVTVANTGTQQYRVVAPKSKVRKAGKSPARNLTGWRWIDLTKQSRLDLGEVSTGAVTLAGTTYAKALTFLASGTLVNVAKLCTTVRLGRGAQDDQSEVGLRVYRMNTLDFSATPTSTVYPITAGAAPQVTTIDVSGISYVAFGSQNSRTVSTVNPSARCTVDKLPTMPDIDL